VHRHGRVLVAGALGSYVGRVSDISGTVYDPLCHCTRLRMTALVNSWAVVRLLGSASLRGDAVGSRWVSSHADLFWATSRERVSRGGAQGTLQGRAGGVPASRSGGGASDSKTLPEYSP
jgi:hypothetical protein